MQNRVTLCFMKIVHWGLEDDNIELCNELSLNIHKVTVIIMTNMRYVHVLTCAYMFVYAKNVAIINFFK